LFFVKFITEAKDFCVFFDGSYKEKNYDKKFLYIKKNNINLMLLNYKKFKERGILIESVIEDIGESKIDVLIDNAYKYFKEIQKPVNTLDIISYVEKSINKELDDEDYFELYYKITGEEFNGNEIYDLDDEEKYIIK